MTGRGASTVCAADLHDQCSGCDGCSCHHVGPPANFRDPVRRELDRKAAAK